MKKKEFGKKLLLHKTTVANLNLEGMKKLKGGKPTSGFGEVTPTAKNTTCPNSAKDQSIVICGPVNNDTFNPTCI